MILKFGDKGADVITLQSQLKKAGYKDKSGRDLIIDGDFGPATEAAVMAVQKKAGLVADGIFGEKTRQALIGNTTSRLLQDADYQAAAKRLNVPALAIRAFAMVEGGTSGFFKSGRPKILFERHKMYAHLQQKFSKSFADTKVAQFPNIVSQTPGGYQGGDIEYQRLELAKQIDEDCALMSASWGQFQIMGENWQALKYQSVQDFVKQQSQSESLQLEAFIRFIEWKSGMVSGKRIALKDALQKQDWNAVFTLYNGVAYKKLGYQAKFQAAWDHLEPIYGEQVA